MRASLRNSISKSATGGDRFLEALVKDGLDATLRCSLASSISSPTPILRSGLLLGVQLEPLNVMEALKTFNPAFLESDGRILLQGLLYFLLIETKKYQLLIQLK